MGDEAGSQMLKEENGMKLELSEREFRINKVRSRKSELMKFKSKKL